MRCDTKKLYTILLAFAVPLFLVPFIPGKFASSVSLAALAVLGAVIGALLIKKRHAPDLRRNEVTLLLGVTAALVVMILYLLGLRFGFYKNIVSFKLFCMYGLPIVAVIIATEVFRSILQAQKKKAITVISYFLFVFLEVVLFAEGNIFRNVSNFMSFFGLTLLPALTSNLLYHIMTAKYGARSVIPYRLVLALYNYIIPFSPAVPRALLAFALLVLPLLAIWFVQGLYAKRAMRTSRRLTAVRAVSTVLCLVIMFLGIAFVAGVFHYKAIVVASDSMKGEFDRGDLLVYEAYNGQPIQVGQVILFKRNNATIIHRVVEIKKINGVIRYYTKGDANEGVDTGYITNDDLVGITNMKVKYIGYPTIWMYDLFKK